MSALTLAPHIFSVVYSNQDLYANGTHKFNVKSFTLIIAVAVAKAVVAISTHYLRITSVRVSNRRLTIKYKTNSSDTRNNKQSNDERKKKNIEPQIFVNTLATFNGTHLHYI